MNKIISDNKSHKEAKTGREGRRRIRRSEETFWMRWYLSSVMNNEEEKAIQRFRDKACSALGTGSEARTTNRKKGSGVGAGGTRGVDGMRRGRNQAWTYPVLQAWTKSLGFIPGAMIWFGLTALWCQKDGNKIGKQRSQWGGHWISPSEDDKGPSLQVNWVEEEKWTGLGYIQKEDLKGLADELDSKDLQLKCPTAYWHSHLVALGVFSSACVITNSLQ